TMPLATMPSGFLWASINGFLWASFDWVVARREFHSNKGLANACKHFDSTQLICVKYIVALAVYCQQIMLADGRESRYAHTIQFSKRR
ncbi:MAG: hypothetical protein ABIA59_01135, partial [Candidatus Latescibacterota bacterium]